MARPQWRLRAELGGAMAGAETALDAADKLCRACVDLLEVDGASISMVHEGANQGTFGSSGEMSRRLDEMQFTVGEGPCLDAVSSGGPVLVPDLDDPAERRWPAFTRVVLESGITAVFAMPVAITTTYVGALDLFRSSTGPLTSTSLAGGLLAAELAALPLLALMTADVDWDALGQGEDGWEQLASLERVEVYQATGMIIGALGVGAAEALVLLRAHAFSQGLTASELAWQVVERRVVVDASGWRRAGDDDVERRS